MDLYTPIYKSREQGAYRFDPWAAEIATMNHAASNLAGLVESLGALIVAGFRGIVSAIQALRKARPVEVEPVQIARPAHVGEQAAANRAAA
jgi:hypothetical protein